MAAASSMPAPCRRSQATDRSGTARGRSRLAQHLATAGDVPATDA